MPLKMNAEISLMDIFAISLALIAGLKMIFSYGPAIDTNAMSIQTGLKTVTSEISHVRAEVRRVESDADKSVAEVKRSIDEVGKEGRQDRKAIEDKIDQLILRELKH